MTEIEKLYKNAEIEAKAKSKELREGLIECSLVYPPFTAEKQLELIKLLAVWEISIKKRWLDTWYISVDGLQKNIKLKGNFTEAIAKYINLNWQDLTEEEKQQIRDILNN